jgi:hypothetical protein
MERFETGEVSPYLVDDVIAAHGDASDLTRLAYDAMLGLVARARHEEVGPWSAASRLNPAGAALDHVDDPDVAESLAFMIEHTREALENLERTAAVARRAC